MDDAPLLPARPLARAVLDALGPTPRRCLVAGSPRVSRALLRAGHSVTDWQVIASDTPAAPGTAGEHRAPMQRPPADLDTFDALVLVGVLARRDTAAEDLQRLVAGAKAGAWVMIAEPAAWGRGGRLLSRVLGRVLHHPVAADVVDLGALCLGAGLRELRQVWPQGLRSLVLTQGRVHPLAAVIDA